MKKRKKAIPARLMRARRRLAAWRGRHRVRARLPQGLWSEAISLALQYGENRTARVLGLDYVSLRKRVAAAAVSKAEVEEAQPSFVELLPPGAAECSIELEDGAGARMRITLKGGAVPDLAVLSHDFWQGAS